VTNTEGPWAVFDYWSPPTLYGLTSLYPGVPIPGAWGDQAHRYRIEWTTDNVIYYIDGTEMARTLGFSGSMRPIITDNVAGAQVNRVDWMRMTPYASSGAFESRVFDGGGPVNWGLVNWTAETPTGTSIVVSVRSGNTPTPDGAWSSYTAVSNGSSLGVSARYVQYRALLSTSNLDQTPVLSEISLRYTPGEIGPATRLGFLIQPGGAVANSPFVTQPVVAVQDANGYIVVSDNATLVTLAIATNPSGGALTCTTNPVTVVNGVAAFSGCRINLTGSGYTLAASGGSLTSATSASFNVTQIPPGSITLALLPTSIPANGTATSVATATVRDTGGNLLPGETVTFSTNGDVTFGPVTDQGNGTYSVPITASLSPGTETITAADGAFSATALLTETLNCGSTCYTDTTESDFLAGTPGSATYIAQTENGEVILAPTVGAEFSGTTLPSGWSALSYGAGVPVATVSGGKVSVGTARLLTDGLYGPGRVLEFVGTYTGGVYQAGGFGYSFIGSDGTIWATFDTVNSGTALYTNTNNTYYVLPGSWLNTPHRYRLEWTATGVTYFIDGVQVDNRSATFLQNMRPIFADNTADANLLQIDWARLSPYAATGAYLSRIMDGGTLATWGTISWTAETPAGTTVDISVRSGSTPVPDGSWTAFQPATNGSSLGLANRYVQYQATLSTTNLDRTPALSEICISYSDITPPTILTRNPAGGAEGVPTRTTVSVEFSEAMQASTINTSTFRLRAVGATQDVPATVSYAGFTATLTPTTPLDTARQYQGTVAGSVSDLAGNPLGSDATWTFTTGDGTFTDTTFADFNSATPAGVYVSEAYSGEVILTPTIVTEFSEGTLPPGWTQAAWNGTMTTSYSGGWASLQTAQLYTNSLYTNNRSIDFVANFGGGAYQSGGFGQSASQYPIAVFNYDAGGGNLRARTYDYVNLVPNPDTWDGTPHRYRVEWNLVAGQIAYYIDGALVGTHTGYDIPNTMRPLFTDYAADGLVNRIDWVRMSPYATSGTLLSREFDAGKNVIWRDLTATTVLPSGTAITFETRTRADGSATWSAWHAVNSPIESPSGRYLQYRASFSTTHSDQTPTLSDVVITYGSAAPTAVTLTSFGAERDSQGVLLRWETASEVSVAGFNLYRRGPFGGWVRENDKVIPPQAGGQMEGALYSFLDSRAFPGWLYEYRLEVVRSDARPGGSLSVIYWPFNLNLPYLLK
jgi:hypothetical protein